MTLIDPLISAGLVNIVLLAAAAGMASRRDRRWAWLAAPLLLSAVALGAILMQHRTDGKAERIAVAFEQVAWAIGPLLFIFVSLAVGRRVTRRQMLLHLAPPGLLVLLGTPLILVWAFEPVGPLLMVPYQMAYTIASAVVFIRRPAPGERTMIGFWWPAAMIVTLTGVHIGQLVRLSPWHDTYSDAVPSAASITVILILLVGLALFFPRARARYAKSPMGGAEAERLFLAAKEMLLGTGAYRCADLSLAEVAARMGVGTHQLSQALSDGGRTSFAELLATVRVEDAKRRLLAPENALVAIEPIGMEAGFRSRSAFYASFRRHTGLTPARFRARATFMS